jgi:sortase A
MDKFTPRGTTLKRSRSLLRWGSNLCLVAGAIALVICCFVWTEAHFFQSYASRHFALEAKTSAARVQLGDGNPVPRKLTNATQPIKNDSLIGKLKIDRLGISVMVLEGVEDNTLRIAAGHVPDTARPGYSGNVAIAAHRDTFFRPLRHIRNGDNITIETPMGSFRYKVEATWIVEPERIDVLNPTAYPALTLITCYPFYFVGNAPHRFIVRARQVTPQTDSGNMPKEVGG